MIVHVFKNGDTKENTNNIYVPKKIIEQILKLIQMRKDLYNE